MNKQVMQSYHAYKDSGVEWIGEIPEDWEVKPGLTVFSENKRNNKGMKEDVVLSLSYGKIIIKPKEKLVGLVPESFETYQIVEPGDIIIRCTDLQNDKTSLRTGLAVDNGIITSAYLNLNVSTNENAEFMHYFLHAIDITKVIYKLGTGLRQNLNYIDFKRLPILKVPVEEQKAIANFLDHKTVQIKKAVELKQQQIALLKERKQIIIQNAVTKGLNPDVKMKDSGVPWIGEIPEQWEVKRIKHLFKLIIEPAPKNNGMELLSIYTDIGVRPRKELKEKGNKASTTDGYWKVEKGDFIVNKLLAWMGAIGLSKYDGVTSPAYDILRPMKTINGEYYHYFFRTKHCSSELKKYSRGIMEMRLRLYFDKFGIIKFPLPPLSEQTAIVTHIESESIKIDKAISLLQQQIDKIREYKTILINNAVTGKIRVGK